MLIFYTMGFAAFATRPPIGPGSDRPLGEREMRVNFGHGLRWLNAGIVQAPAQP